MPRALPFLALAFLGAPLLAQTTWTVDDDGPADFSDLQAAVNAAATATCCSCAKAATAR
jgi:hypothetical protein